MIILRKEVEALKAIKKWTLVYGRRKTGKTFSVRNFLKFDEYFFVKRDKSIFVESTKSEMNYETFKAIFTRLLTEEKVVVVDEFHRLGDDFSDFLHFIDKKGRVILITSTFHLGKKIITSKSPLLGLFAEFPINLLNLEDIIKSLHEIKDRKELLEAAVILREPLVIDYFKDGIKPREAIAKAVSLSKYTIPALVGEIFTEEERSLSTVYEGILRAIANGKETSNEIANYIHSKNLVEKNDASIIQPYFTNLINFGLIKRVKVVNKNSFVYRHLSPLIHIFYYGDEKYNLSETISPQNDFLLKIIDEVMPKLIEHNISETAARKFALIEGTWKSGKLEVDIILQKFNKDEIAIEVKWKNKVGQQDNAAAEENLSKINAKRKILFVPNKQQLKFNSKLEIMDPIGLLD